MGKGGDGMIANRFNPLGVSPPLSAKEYIQDGLIHMYDAIENAGWGVHEDAPTAWKDLIGTRDLPIRTSGVTFSTNRAHFVGNAIQETSGGFISQFREAVFNSSTEGWIVSTTLGTGSHLWLTNGYIGNAYYYSNPAIVCDWANKTISASLNETSNNSGKYLNGAPATNFSSQTNGPNNVTGVSIGRNIVGYICIVRIYNRELTAEEVAHNYAVDQARYKSAFMEQGV